jgi:hypothetical protein
MMIGDTADGLFGVPPLAGPSVDSSSKMVAKIDPILFVIKCRHMCKQEAHNEAPNPFSVAYGDIAFTQPSRIG